jgi:hypothetical protein
MMIERDDDVDTARMDSVRWLDPVGTHAELPAATDQVEGCLCYVQQDETVWQVRAGTWVQVERRTDLEP